MTPTLIRTHSPLHLGVGQSPSALDLPIERDQVTGAPSLSGSSLKGALRARYAHTRQAEDPTEEEIFGPLVRGLENASDYSGAVEVHGASLLLFPVASPLAGWAWVTSPLALSQLYAQMSPEEVAALPLPRPKEDEALGPYQLITPWTDGELFWARDLDFHFKESRELHAWADWLTASFMLDPANTKHIHRRLVCLHDDVAAMVWQQMTQVVTRNRIDPVTGVVADRALWNEELVPADTFFLAALAPITARCEQLKRDGGALVSALAARCASFSVGGKVSVGRGLCSLSLKEG